MTFCSLIMLDKNDFAVIHSPTYNSDRQTMLSVHAELMLSFDHRYDLVA
jgi:hypothetical protein